MGPKATTTTTKKLEPQVPEFLRGDFYLKRKIVSIFCNNFLCYNLYLTHTTSILHLIIMIMMLYLSLFLFPPQITLFLRFMCLYIKSILTDCFKSFNSFFLIFSRFFFYFNFCIF